MNLNKPLIGANFFAGDVAGGIGPYLAIYLLAIQHWSPGQIGIALALGSITTVIAQAPAGGLIDAVKWKRYLLVCCALAIAASTLSIIFFRSDLVIYAAQMAIGLASAFLGPSIGPRRA
jgi:MFS family permease